MFNKLATINPQDNKKCIEEIKSNLFQDLYWWILKTTPFNDDTTISRANCSESRVILTRARWCCSAILLMSWRSQPSNQAFAVLLLSEHWLTNQQRHDCAVQPDLSACQEAVTAHLTLAEEVQLEKQRALWGRNVWFILFEIFTNILQDLSLKSTYLIIDVLDKCVTNLLQLLDLIVQKSSISSHVKWIVSSCNWLIIEKQLKTAEQKVRLSLELNADSVSLLLLAHISDIKCFNWCS
jgi:hypothetical protein